MRVLQSMAGAQHGGAEAFFVRLAVALHRVGLDQRVVIRREPTRAGQLMAAGIAPRQLRYGGKLDFLTPLLLAAEIRRYKPDIVLSWMSRAAAMAPKGGSRFCHVGRLGGYYDLKYYQTCDHLIGNTPDIVDYIVRSGWPANRASYLPNFVSAATAAPVSRRNLSTPNAAPVVLALGRYHRNKAFDVLLEAVRRLPDVYVWLIGDGPLAADLKEQAVVAGIAPRVRFLSWVADPAPYYAAADVVACPSRWEPLGNVVLEAWAQERPIVAAASAGPQQLIRDGENGLLVPLEDANALAGALHRTLNDSKTAAKLAAGGRASYEADYSEAKIVARYMDFFRTLTA